MYTKKRIRHTALIKPLVKWATVKPNPLSLCDATKLLLCTLLRYSNANFPMSSRIYD